MEWNRWRCCFGVRVESHLVEVLVDWTVDMRRAKASVTLLESSLAVVNSNSSGSTPEETEHLCFSKYN